MGLGYPMSHLRGVTAGVWYIGGYIGDYKGVYWGVYWGLKGIFRVFRVSVAVLHMIRDLQVR